MAEAQAAREVLEVAAAAAAPASGAATFAAKTPGNTPPGVSRAGSITGGACKGLTFCICFMFLTVGHVRVVLRLMMHGEPLM